MRQLWLATEPDLNGIRLVSFLNEQRVAREISRSFPWWT